MKSFEISKEKVKNGKRPFKAILHEIYPDSSIDETNEVGTIYNANGITWIREYCEEALPSIKDMSIRVEFLDEERTEICGHGETGEEKDGSPIFEDAVSIGHFTNGYIGEIEEDGITKTVCFAEGVLDDLCYRNYISKLEEEIENDTCPSGSVEILKTEKNKEIKYKYGYKDKGRIPMEYIYSGFAILGITPADETAKIVELNNKEAFKKMTETEMKNIASLIADELVSRESEINKCKEECEELVAKAKEAEETALKEKNEVVANSEKIQEALDKCRGELEETWKKSDSLYEELDVLKEELGKAKAKERIGELNEAISAFTEKEREYAKTEIESFKADPITSEINSVVNKIWGEIGKKAKEASVVSEQNSQQTDIVDIFSEVILDVESEDTNIF